MSIERKEAAQSEVRKLLKANVIREIAYPEWLANPVLVKKSNGKWRMCIDFTLLNKACPKVDFPLARIDQIVDSIAGCERLCFLDMYSGYHQVWMAEENQPCTSFITPDWTYCYLRMPFKLRNAVATFALLVQIAFDSRSGATSRLMGMTSSSKARGRQTSSPICARPSTSFHAPASA